MNTKDTRAFLEKHYRRTGGANLNKEKYPIPASLGTGFRIQYEDKWLKTVFPPFLDTGKRELKFRISSYRGISIGAVHYYCTAVSYIENEVEGRPGYCIGLSPLDRTIPEENKTLRFELIRPLTAEEIKDDPERWSYFDEGDSVIAFEDKEDILEIIEQFKQILKEDEWIVRIEDYG